MGYAFLPSFTASYYISRPTCSATSPAPGPAACMATLPERSSALHSVREIFSGEELRGPHGRTRGDTARTVQDEGGRGERGGRGLQMKDGGRGTQEVQGGECMRACGRAGAVRLPEQPCVRGQRQSHKAGRRCYGRGSASTQLTYSTSWR